MFGDQAYWNESHRQTALTAGIRYRINRKSTRKPLSKYQRYINRRRSAARIYTAFALANLYLLRRRLLPPQWTCAL